MREWIALEHAIIMGATGFVGVHLAAELIFRGVRVTALCRENSPNILRLPKDVEKVFCSDNLTSADVFYHLAWEGASGMGRADAKLQAQNAEMTLSALNTAHELGCGKFIALGTIYEKLASIIKASEKFSGSDFYILSKDYARLMSNQLAYKLGIDFAWCTVCHPIGRFIKPEQMISYAVSSLIEGKKPTFGPAEIQYDILAVEDLAQGLYLAGNNKLARREYYIGSGEPKPLRDWLEGVCKVLGTDISIGIGERPDDGLRFDASWFDITPLAEETGYAPRVSFAESVNNVAGWLRE